MTNQNWRTQFRFNTTEGEEYAVVSYFNELNKEETWYVVKYPHRTPLSSIASERTQLESKSIEEAKKEVEGVFGPVVYL